MGDELVQVVFCIYSLLVSNQEQLLARFQETRVHIYFMVYLVVFLSLEFLLLLAPLLFTVFVRIR